jgi:hypothetical protein
VPPQGSVEEPWILSASHHWYDLSVSSNDDPTFLRRVTSRMAARPLAIRQRTRASLPAQNLTPRVSPH